MADGFIGEIRLFPLNFQPIGWVLCNGQNLLISQNQALFALIGITFGGDIQQGNFMVPNLQGLVVASSNSTDSNFVYAHKTGDVTATLNTNNIPQHSHLLTAKASSAGTTGMTSAPTADVSMLSRAVAANNKPFYASTSDKAPAVNIAVSLTPVGGDANGVATPHDNMMPYLAMNYFICVEGEFPIPA